MESVVTTASFGGVYRGLRVLLTGHTGFKGSWLALWLQRLGADVAGIALDPFTQPAHWSLLGLELEADHRIDLRDAAALARAVRDFRPQMVFHLAAQAVVRRGYAEPAATFESNVQGLVNLFEALRGVEELRAVINATTDKVYEAAPDGHPFDEDAPLGGHDPYSASKACAEIVTASYRRSFFEAAGVRVATARAGNVIGGGDWAEDRLVPDLVRALQSGAPVRLRRPEAVRPWQHVLDPLSGYLRLGQCLLQDPPSSRAFNFGPDPADSLAVGEVVAGLQTRWHGPAVQRDTAPQPHETATLRLDSSRAQRQLQWTPVWRADEALRRTADWYTGFLRDGRIGSGNDLDAYVADAAARDLSWVGT